MIFKNNKLNETQILQWYQPLQISDSEFNTLSANVKKSMVAAKLVKIGDLKEVIVKFGNLRDCIVFHQQ